ncbi:MAG: hypothetical protein KBC34_00880 [Phenylobacterium sp.]|nr:hypothetical protein [Phenylobacterium sp.]
MPGAELPPADATAGRLWRLADEQTAQLDKANGRGDTILEVIDRCEARDLRTREIQAAPGWKRPFMKAP